MIANKSKETQKDERARAIENNPCNTCRAFALPICRGHGGGGGGGGGSGAAGDGDLSAASNIAPDFMLSTDEDTIIKALTQGGWTLAEDTDLVFEFDDPFALLTIKLDMESGLLELKGKDDLSPEEQQILDELFDDIENELALFNKELLAKNVQIGPIKIVREPNSLSIRIPDPQYFDAFIQRLMNKNLLPTPAPELQEKDEISQSIPKESLELTAQEKNAPTAPNPFDISRGPRPQNWIEGQ